MVDSTKLVFNANGTGIDKIKVGSILVSDISNVAPVGFLRKVTAITTTNGNLICTTEQASLTDAIIKADVQYSKTFTDNDIIREDTSGIDISGLHRPLNPQGLSFNFSYKIVVYDADGSNQTTYDQVYIEGDMKIEPTFNFELKIDGSTVKKLLTSISIKNTNNIKAESKVTLASLSKEVVLKTFELEPFTIPIFGVPVPIAKQWIAIVIGVDGNLSARITTGAQNVNTVNAGIDYENNTWNTINTIDNNFTLQPITLEGAARVEPWLQIRYEIRPYGIKESRIYIGARGSVIGEATLSPAGLNITTKWGVKFSAKAQMQIWDRAILDYEKIFYEKEFPISQSTAFAFPTLTTTTIEGVTQTTAQSGGNITSDGGAPVTVRGACWNTTPNPTIANNKTSYGTGTGSFVSSLTGLTANTTYYLRAYATNSAGTAYGSTMTFTTQQTNGGTVADIDGNIYNTVTIGTQVWMKENLKTSHYRNGNAIPTGLSDAVWGATTLGAYTIYDNDAANNITYGKLYNWYAVNDPRGLAPTGWHVPSDAEWKTLTNFLGKESVAGGAMKSTAGWSAPNTGATNSSGFSGLPGGFRQDNGLFGGIGDFGYWWSSTEDFTKGGAWATTLYYDYSITFRTNDGSTAGWSVRCVRN